MVELQFRVPELSFYAVELVDIKTMILSFMRPNLFIEFEILEFDNLVFNKFYSVERKLRHPILKFNHAYCLTLKLFCCCRLCYLISSFLCALPQYVCMLLSMVLDPQDAADTRSSLSAVFQAGGLQVICA